jgi:hypothetical protein
VTSKVTNVLSGKPVVFMMLAACVVPAAEGTTLPSGRPQCDDKSSDQFFYPAGWIGDEKVRSGNDQSVRR